MVRIRVPAPNRVQKKPRHRGFLVSAGNGLAVRTEAVAVEDQVETLHVGRNHDHAPIVIREVLQRGVYLVLQILGGQA